MIACPSPSVPSICGSPLFKSRRRYGAMVTAPSSSRICIGYAIPSLQMLGCHPSPGWFGSIGSGAGISITDGVGEATAVSVSRGSGESTSLSSVSRRGMGRGSGEGTSGVSNGGGVDLFEYGGGISVTTGEGSRTTTISPLVSLAGNSGSGSWKCTRLYALASSSGPKDRRAC